MKELIKKIKEKMIERNYWLCATNGDETILYYGSPFEKKPYFGCEVYIKSEDNVEFKFRYLTKSTIILTTENIGSFFNDKHFSKFESELFVLANELFEFENKE